MLLGLGLEKASGRAGMWGGALSLHMKIEISTASSPGMQHGEVYVRVWSCGTMQHGQVYALGAVGFLVLLNRWKDKG